MSPKTVRELTFREYRLDIVGRQLTGPQGPIKLTGHNLDVLIFLVVNRDRMCSSQEIFEGVWGSKWDLGCANNVDQAISAIRKALGDQKGQDRFIKRETNRGTRFVAPVETPLPRSRSLAKLYGAVGLITTSACFAAGILFLHSARSNRHFEAVQIRRITDDETLKRVPVVCDRERAYFTEEQNGRYSIRSVRLADDFTQKFDTTVPNPYVVAISPSLNELLLRQVEGDFNNDDCPLWIQNLRGGKPKLVGPGGVKGFDGTWTPDGQRLVVCHGKEILQTDLKSGQSQKLATVNGFAWWPRWSPDGQKLRFTVQSEASDDSLWEIRPDGSGLHPVFSAVNVPWSHAGCGTWSKDGSYFLFDGPPNSQANPRDKALWIWDESHAGLPHVFTSQVGRLRGPSWIGNRDEVWVRGESLGARPITLDLKTKRQTTSSAAFHFETAGMSGDGKWIAYTTEAPGDELWISRVDGGSPRRLVAQPVQCAFPEWSIDNRHIAVMTKRLSEKWRVTIIDTQTGQSMPETPADENAFHPTWYPDGAAILFSGIPALEQGSQVEGLHKLDLATRAISNLKGTQGLYRPSLSPDGRWILCLRYPDDALALYNVSTHEVREMTKSAVHAPIWRKNSQSVLFLRKGDTNGSASIEEMSIGSDKQAQEIAQLHGVVLLDRWMCLSPDEKLILVESLGRQQLFAVKIHEGT